MENSSIELENQPQKCISREEFMMKNSPIEHKNQPQKCHIQGRIHQLKKVEPLNLEINHRNASSKEEIIIGKITH
jgi:hypothetical protein